jgi:hypothetical protein
MSFDKSLSAFVDLVAGRLLEKTLGVLRQVSGRTEECLEFVD